MEGNKDDAERCVAMAESAIESMEFQKALRLLRKSQRLFPLPRVPDLLAEVEKRVVDVSGDADRVQPTNGSATATSHRDQENDTAGISPSSPQKVPSATSDQKAVVTRIRRCTDLYDVLDVSKTCSQEDIKKAYRKLSLKVHPDKNSAPGAEEAFKSVSRAFQCLSDTSSRAKYDVQGPAMFDHPEPRRYSGRRAHPGEFRPFDNDFDPNDVFQAFFGGNANGRVFRAHFGHPANRHRQGQGQGQGGPSLIHLLQLLPLLAIALFALVPSPEPHYQMNRADPYVLERKTSSAGVSFYVKSEDFDQMYPEGSRGRYKIDLSVETQYKDILENRCYYERVQQAQLSRWGEHKKAREFSMPNCQMLREMRKSSVVW